MENDSADSSLIGKGVAVSFSPVSPPTPESVTVVPVCDRCETR